MVRGVRMGIGMLGLIAAVSLRGEGIAVVSNRNFEDCRNAVKSAVTSLQGPAGERPAVMVVELDGGAGDPATLKRLRASRPSVAVSLGAYATRAARKALPDTWIVYAMVPYPEVEGFTSDPKMAGVAALGGEGVLRRMTRGFLAQSKLAVLHSVVIEESIPPLLARLRASGFDAEAFPLSEAPLMESSMDELTAKFSAVLLLPDPVTENPDRLRFIITRCASTKVVPLALTQGLVNRGALCGSVIKPNKAGERAAGLALKILSGASGVRGGSVVAADSSPAVNGPVANLFGVTVEGVGE